VLAGKTTHCAIPSIFNYIRSLSSHPKGLLSFLASICLGELSLALIGNVAARGCRDEAVALIAGHFR
jgi:hypothetical protein